MADGPSVGDAATDLGNDNRRVPRERYKRLESVPGTAKLFLSQDDKSSIEVLEPQLKHQRFDASDDSSSSSSSSISSSNQQVVVVVKNSSRFIPSSSGDDCEQDADVDGDDEDEDGGSGEIASVKPSVALTKVTSLISTSNDSVAEDADGPVVGFVEEASERMLVREKDKTRKMGKGGCIKKIEKVITVVECGESREMRKEEVVEDDEEEASKGKEGLSQGRVTTGRLQGSPFKGQIRSVEDTLGGPCGKKRCADRYDSSESSDSGVAVSCGECSSSGTSDITEPGSPCSTSSDEGVGIRGTSASPLPSLGKLAPPTPTSHSGTRPRWPWTPPLATTACSTYKRLKTEPEAGTLPRAGAADPSARQVGKASGKGHQHHHESQGKITEYFKTQIKPQQQKIKKASDMSILVAKNSSEFRRPPTVQRNNKGGLAKYLGAVTANTRSSNINDWDMRDLTMSPPPFKKSPLVLLPRSVVKLEKKLSKPMPGLPIPKDVLSTLPNCTISPLRLIPDASSDSEKGSSPHSTSPNSLEDEPLMIGFKDNIIGKPMHVNENNNLNNNTVACANALLNSRSQGDHQFLRLSIPADIEKKENEIIQDDEEDEEEEDLSRDGVKSKPPLSQILSAPTTIRFPAQTPDKDRSQSGDSGFCRWDKCEASFESSGGLLEHLQTAHINTQTGGDNFVCQWKGCKVQGRTSCSRRWLERHVMSHGGNKPFRCIVDGCGSRFSSQTALERHVNGHFNQPETSSSSGRRSCENGGKLVRRNGKRLRYRRQPWSARLFDYFDTGVMEGLQHRLLELAKSRTQGRLAETPGNAMTLTSQVVARRVEPDGQTKFLLRWYPQGIISDEWVLESEVQRVKHVEIRKVAATCPEEMSLALYPAIKNGSPPQTRSKQRRKPIKNS